MNHWNFNLKYSTTSKWMLLCAVMLCQVKIKLMLFNVDENQVNVT